MAAALKNMHPLTRIESGLVRLVTEPLTWVAGGIFFNISGVTDYAASLSSVESAVFVAGIATAFVRLFFGTDRDRTINWLPAIGVVGFGLLSVSLLTSLLNGQNLGLLDDYGWRHFAKFILLITIGLMAYPEGGATRFLHPVIYGALAVLAVSVLIRFHIFKEFHPETGRMALSGRHGDPNFACLFMTIGIIYALCYLSKAPSRAGRITHPTLGCLFLVTAWFTESRAGLAVLAASFAAAVMLMPLGKIRTLILGGVFTGALAAFVITGERLLGRYLGIADASNSGRLAGIRAAQDMLLEQPLWGSGFDSSSRFVQPYLDVLFASNSVALEIHTTPLQIAGELGLAGLLIYGMLYFGIIWLIFCQYRSKKCLTPVEIGSGLITLSILANMVSIPMTYIGTVHGIAMVLLYEQLTRNESGQLRG